MLSALDVDLYTHVVDNKEADDIFRAFFFAGVAEIEASTDLALAETMYRAAWKYRIGYVLEGHSFLTEGITPVGRNYFDGRYIESIHSRFGTRPMRTYPLMTFSRFLFWTAVARIRKVRPSGTSTYTKEEARRFLERAFGWRYYGGHHLENRMTAFCHGIYLPQKFGADMRNNSARCSRPHRNDVAGGSVGRVQHARRWSRRTCSSTSRSGSGSRSREYARVMAEPPHVLDRVSDLQAAIRAAAAAVRACSRGRTSCR